MNKHNCCSVMVGTKKWTAKTSELSQLRTLVGGTVNRLMCTTMVLGPWGVTQSRED